MNLTPSVQHGHPAKHNLTVARVKLETLVTIESFPSDMDCAARFYTTKEGLHSCRNYTSKQEFQSVEGKKNNIKGAVIWRARLCRALHILPVTTACPQALDFLLSPRLPLIH